MVTVEKLKGIACSKQVMAVEFNWIGRGASRVPEDTQLREQKA
jgi:hypothetical protein